VEGAGRGEGGVRGRPGASAEGGGGVGDVQTGSIYLMIWASSSLL
jgi:hypothetical protein